MRAVSVMLTSVWFYGGTINQRLIRVDIGLKPGCITTWAFPVIGQDVTQMINLCLCQEDAERPFWILDHSFIQQSVCWCGPQRNHKGPEGLEAKHPRHEPELLIKNIYRLCSTIICHFYHVITDMCNLKLRFLCLNKLINVCFPGATVLSALQRTRPEIMENIHHNFLTRLRFSS